MIELYLAVVPVVGAVAATALVAAVLRLRYRSAPALDLLPAHDDMNYTGPRVGADDGQPRRPLAHPPAPGAGANAVALDE